MTTETGTNPHRRPSVDGLLPEDGLCAKAATGAFKHAIAGRIRDRRLSKVAMAARTGTPGSRLDRVPNPENGNVTSGALPGRWAARCGSNRSDA